DLLDFNTASSEKIHLEGASLFQSTLFMTFALIAGCAAILIAAVIFAITGIARPIEAITTSMKVLAGGNDEAAIPFSGRSDEIGDMA
ncbi:hypothetical protein SB724_20705, partial [Bacillus sp. SIMBA_031]